MLITQSFEVDQPVDSVWKFFDNIPLVAACLPGANLNDQVGDEYQGGIVISAGPVKLEFAGSARVKERDDANRILVLDAGGADKKGRGTASALLTCSLKSLGASTKVTIAMDLTITGQAAQYARGGLVEDVTGVLIAQTAESMRARLVAIAEGRDPMAIDGPKSASGLAIGLTAFARAAKRVFARFFLPYHPAPSR